MNDLLKKLNIVVTDEGFEEGWYKFDIKNSVEELPDKNEYLVGEDLQDE